MPMNLNEIIKKLTEEDIEAITNAALELSQIKKEEFDNYGFDNAISEIIEVLEIFNKLEKMNPSLWNYIKNHDLSKNLNEISDIIRDKLRKLNITPYNLNDLGINAQDNEDEDQAIKYYKQAIILDPSYRWSWYNLGNIYRNKNNNSKAVECYEKAVEIYPNYGDAWNNMGNAFFDLDNLNKALDAYNKAANIKSYENKNYPIYNMGLIYEQKGNKKEALKYFKKAIAIKNDYSKALYNAGRVLHEMGNYIEANEFFTKALINEFDKYYDDIQKFKINVYDLLGKHLISNILSSIELDENFLFDSELNQKLLKSIKNQDYPFKDTLNIILEDFEYNENWSRVLKTADPEKIDNHIKSWIIKECGNTEILNDPLLLGDFIIKLFIRSLNNFPGSEFSKKVNENLIYSILEKYNYFKSYLRTFQKQIKSLNYVIAKEQFIEYNEFIQKNELVSKYKSSIFKIYMISFEFCKNKIEEINDVNDVDTLIKKNLIDLSSNIIRKFINIVMKKFYKPNIGFFLLDCIKFYYNLKRYQLCLICAEKTKAIFKKLDFKKDIKKCESIIKKIKKLV
ncbi:MAG: tetratricopeptide repeat protein [Candidatus Lokiarchaeota archaeon]|nr:tetratricopeptide repeat protein [Candidatus Lokiarchaeota archaeon]